MKPITNELLLRQLRHFALADCYSVRDTRIILEARGFKVPSVDFVWKYFKEVRKNNKKRR